MRRQQRIRHTIGATDKDQQKHWKQHEIETHTQTKSHKRNTTFKQMNINTQNPTHIQNDTNNIKQYIKTDIFRHTQTHLSLSLTRNHYNNNAIIEHSHTNDAEHLVGTGLGLTGIKSATRSDFIKAQSSTVDY